MSVQAREQPMAAPARLSARVSERLLVRLPIFLVLLLLAVTTVYPLIFLTLNAFKELQLVFQTFWGYTPFKIKLQNGKTRTYDSLVCANIPRMAKVLKLSDDQTNRPDDGLFELILVPGGSKLRLIITALRLITIGPAKAHKLSTYSFETLKPMPMQLDGEVVDLGAHAKITVTAAKQVLNTLV